MSPSTPASSKPRVVRAPRGTEITCKGWQQEAALRMLMNNLDPEVAERPEDLVVYGGSGKAARNWECFDAIVATLRELRDDQTLLIQSGKPVAVMPTHKHAPRVLLANSHLVPKWATWDYFRKLEAEGLMMYGQMTAGSWIYIGTQGIIQGTYETFAEAGRQHFGGDLTGRVVLTAGLGGMGGAQPLAASMAGAVSLNIEIDPLRARRRLQSGFLDQMAENLDDALKRVEAAKTSGKAISIGLVGNAAEVLWQLLEKGFQPDLVTDQTSAHDELNGYVPHGMSLEHAEDLRKKDPARYKELSVASMRRHVEAMVEFQRRGCHVFDYGNNIRAMAVAAGMDEKKAFSFPGFVPAYIRPQFCLGRGPFRWVALSGDPEDIRVTDEEILKLFPEDEGLKRWITMAQKRIQFQGLPARICWLGYGQREKAGLLFNRLVREGKVKAPIVIGRDHLDCGSVASPNRETEGMKDGSDAVADWPVLSALLGAVNGASWMSLHHGGGVGIGYSIHSGMVVVADGTEDAEWRLTRVLNSDPGMGVVRHADAGYDSAKEIARGAFQSAAAESRWFDFSKSCSLRSEFTMKNEPRVFLHASELLTGEGVAKKRGRRVQEEDLGRIEDGALVVSESKGGRPGKVLWVGPTRELPKRYLKWKAKNLKNRQALVPGLVDCHTHLVFAGDRSEEFALRCGGTSYEEIAKRGGGILSTVRATRGATEAELERLAALRVKEAYSFGVRTLEVKSGYGLDFESELKCLRVVKRLRKQFPEVEFQSTFLGAHAFPKDRTREEYFRDLCEKMLPEVARGKWAEACDVFVDQGYFTLQEAEELLVLARELGLKTKIHADELTETGSASLAARLGCLSADHLLKISNSGIQALARSETVAVLLPGTAFYLKAAHAPARKLLDSGARVALSTDFNPGTCMTLNLPFIMSLSALYLGMTRAEIFASVTYNAAAALGFQDRLGTLTVGAEARYWVMPFARFEEAYYRLAWGAAT